MARVSKSDQAEAIERLREWVKPGDTVYTVLRSVSRSGMSRSIDLYKFATDDQTGRLGKIGLSYNVALAGIGSWDAARECVKVGGSGMDMGFALVYDLGHVLYPAGFGCTGEGCTASDHANGDRDYMPHACTDGVFDEQHQGNAAGRSDTGDRCHWHTNGGYALRHEWI